MQHAPAPMAPVIEQDTVDGAFTPFARTNLLYENGYVRDTNKRYYVLGGRAEDGRRIRHETYATLLAAWVLYVTHAETNLLWVMWSDGRRHLVHRKGTSYRQEA